MKRFKILCLVMLMMLLSIVGVHAESDILEVNTLFNYVNIKIDGTDQDVDNLLYEGTTFVPLRYISEIFGKNVEWIQDTKTVIISDIEVEQVEEQEVVEDEINSLIEKASNKDDISFIKDKIDNEVLELEKRLLELKKSQEALDEAEQRIEEKLEEERLREEEKKKDEVLKEIVVLPTSEYDEEEANNMIKRISRVDYKILKKLKDRGSKLYLINGKITDIAGYSHLKGVVPRGWEGLGKTWDDMVGIGGANMIAKIGYSNPGREHGSLNLELHELAHTVDYVVFNEISSRSEFKEIWEKEVRKMFTIDYIRTYPEEYFAEAFSYYYLSDSHRETLQRKAPLTYDFFTTLKDRIN